MATRLASLFIQIGGDTATLAAAVTKAEGHLARLEKSSTGAGASMRRMWETAGGVMAAGAIQSAAGKLSASVSDSMKATSALNETVSKSPAVFKDSAGEIEAWASGAARAFGQSKREALDAAGGFGNMFDQLGIGSAEAAKMSMKITQLASDFASFHNADISQVLEAQSAGFRGEYDALQKFLPLINAAAVEQKAMAQTGKENTKELTGQEKALAVYALMLEGAGKAQGDFAKTAGGAANQERILKAVQEDRAASVGRVVLPAQIALNKAILEAPAAVQAATFAVQKMGPELLVLAGALGQAALAAKTFAPNMLVAGSSTATLIPILGKATLATAALYAGWLAFDAVMPQRKLNVESLADAEARLAGAHGVEKTALEALVGAWQKVDQGRAAQEKKVTDGYSKIVASANAAARDTGTAAQTAATRAKPWEEALAKIVRQAESINKPLSDAARTLAGLGNVKTPEMARLDSRIADADVVLADLAIRLDDAQRKGQTALVKSLEQDIARMEGEKTKVQNLITLLAAQVTQLEKSGAAQVAAAGQSAGLLKSHADLKTAIKDSTDELLKNIRVLESVPATFTRILTEMEGQGPRWRKLFEFDPGSGLGGGLKPSGQFPVPAPEGFAGGLANVPYDNYPALLHRNERVLTARENREYRSVTNNNNQKPVTIYGNVINHYGDKRRRWVAGDDFVGGLA